MNPVENIFEEILKITRVEFEDIVDVVSFVNYKLRLVLKDKSFVDVGISKRISGRFSFHWECKNQNLYRYDNFPDEQWKNVETYPFHFHKGTQNKVDASPFSADLLTGFREFMEFVRKSFS
ncbi:MAG: hypothetical protein GTO45_00230 [Candidatus Aminicenantes bacterium]|nr:hypothetical protein [Candidatus Aminicenantes bacterium]NIM77194.1 hypothetical protein [Candidatus Aminicenantes bacterium]NIN16487.1 hypothetical protein [Candidatus Aminicenantes bacterium]NIN40348.1 hypothetical protein [Candidatus Aminicenantes bacterium]NIN83167.1 hypothetical protein [Candidatus Aminicenantes bacterium]